MRVNDLNADLAGGLFEIGTTGSAPGQFNNPTGVAIDTESRIYAVDCGNNRIQVFDSSGNIITTFGSGGSGSGLFNNAQGIAVDSRHRVYVCDQGNARVQVLQFDTGTGTLSYLGLLTGRTLLSPVAVAIGPNDNIFVTDCSGSRNSIEAYSSNGNWLHTYAQATGVYTGTLNYPTGMAVDQNGLLVVCDTNNKRVVSISVAEPIAVAAAKSLADGSAVQLEGKTVTAAFNGYFYVQDSTGLPGIRVVSSTSVTIGQIVDVYGTLSTLDGERRILATVVVVH